MKAKIFAFLGLAVATIGVSLFALVMPVHAAGEKYEWINPTTIRASGGLYSQVSAAKNGVIDFPQIADGSFQIVSKGDCTITMTITITSADNKQGALATQGCDDQAKDFDRTLTIANPQNGPVSYATANCSDPSQNHGDSTKCAAVKACLTTGGQTEADCSSAYDTCIKNHTKDGKISDADKKSCVDNVTNGNLTAANTAPASANKTSCAIQGIGWIVCPVTNFLAKIVDAAYGFVSSLLTVQPLYTNTANANPSNPSAGIFLAWSIMRNFANVAFVIAFMIIIFSQVTSIGITNYGVKRLLPRIIVSAILVNISYWICAALIDVSNILGTSMTQLFQSIQASISLPSGIASSTGQGWEGIAGGILAGAVGAITVIYIGLSALLPMLLAALIAIVTVFLVLSLRQALIVLLVVIAPLAFVAYLLPNTETWFKKWRDLFQTLLLMYPIISIIFGASALASKIVMGTAKGDYAIAIQLMGAGISVIPLAITPIVMKTAGGLLNRFGGIVNNPNKGPFDRMRKGISGYRENREQYRQLKGLSGYRTLPGKGYTARRSAAREAVLNNRKSELTRAKAGYVAGMAAGNEGFRGKMAQGGTPGADERAFAQAISIQAKLTAEEVTAATAIIKNANLENDITKLQELAINGETKYTDSQGKIQTLKAPAGSALQTAAIKQQFKIGDISKTDELVSNSGSMGVDQRQAIAEGMAGLSGKVKYYGGASGDAVAKGQINNSGDLNKLVADTIEAGKFSAETLASTDKDALTRIANVAGTATSVTSGADGRGEHAIDPGRKQALRDAVTEIKNTDTIKNPDTRSQERLDKIETGSRYP